MYSSDEISILKLHPTDAGLDGVEGLTFQWVGNSMPTAGRPYMMGREFQLLGKVGSFFHLYGFHWWVFLPQVKGYTQLTLVMLGSKDNDFKMREVNSITTAFTVLMLGRISQFLGKVCIFVIFFYIIQVMSSPLLYCQIALIGWGRKMETLWFGKVNIISTIGSPWWVEYSSFGKDCHFCNIYSSDEISILNLKATPNWHWPWVAIGRRTDISRLE